MNFLICDDELEFALHLKERLEMLMGNLHQTANIQCVCDENEMKTVEKIPCDIIFWILTWAKSMALSSQKRSAGHSRM